MSTHHATPVHTPADNGSFLSPQSLPLLIAAGLVLAMVGWSLNGTIAKKPKLDPITLEKAMAARLQKVGTVTLQSAKRELQNGEQVFKAQCTNCHTAGLVGAPKFGDAAAWAPRIKTGYDALLNSAVKGKNAMGPQAGAAYGELEVGRAVVYMANAAGAKFAEPAAPATDAAK